MDYLCIRLIDLVCVPHDHDVVYLSRLRACCKGQWCQVSQRCLDIASIKVMQAEREGTLAPWSPHNAGVHLVRHLWMKCAKSNSFQDLKSVDNILHEKSLTSVQTVVLGGVKRQYIMTLYLMVDLPVAYLVAVTLKTVVCSPQILEEAYVLVWIPTK